VFFHWSTFHPVRFHHQITEWAGGYFDYETGNTPNHWYSAIQTWNADSKLGIPEHPLARGVKPFPTQEEYYYRIKFRDNDPRLKPIVLTRPPKETNDFAVGWAVERADGGRGFGFTGGHFYQNWWNPDFRKLVLNAIVWTAKLDVPERGVRSEPRWGHLGWGRRTGYRGTRNPRSVESGRGLLAVIREPTGRTAGLLSRKRHPNHPRILLQNRLYEVRGLSWRNGRGFLHASFCRAHRLNSAIMKTDAHLRNGPPIAMRSRRWVGRPVRHAR
jgi:hypothetical protein